MTRAAVSRGQRRTTRLLLVRSCRLVDSRGESCSLPPMQKHVVILGAGFGGLELATRLSETVGDAVRVTLIDRNDSFYFGFSKLEVMLGRQSADEVRLYYRDFKGRRRVPPGDGDGRRPGQATCHHRRRFIRRRLPRRGTWCRLRSRRDAGLRGGRARVLLARRCRATARRACRLQGRQSAPLGTRAAVEVPASPL